MSRKTSTHAVLTLAVLAALVTAAVLYAGPLDPPAGPVAPTFKTLAEVEPRIAINTTNTPGDGNSLFKISQPGSYYLTGNITGVVGKHGIEIGASGVTIDLSGYSIVGVPAMGNFDGVAATGIGLTGIAVRNGSVRNWGGRDGINLATFPVSACQITGIRVSDSARHGISAGPGCVVTGCAAFRNLGDGIIAGAGSTITGCAASNNTGTGITTTDTNGAGASIVSQCTAYHNGADGISIATGGTVADCTVQLSGLNGIVCSSLCVIHSNTCSGSGNGAGLGSGILAGGNNRIEGNHCTTADFGMTVSGSNNTIVRNTCSNNTIDWIIALRNYYGPIVDRTGVLTGSVNGSSATGTLATTDPHANFSN